MNKNASAWESEYRDPQFLTLGTEPLSDVKDFLRFIKKQTRMHSERYPKPIHEWTVLDLGCGNGKNVRYVVDNYCARGIGYDISPTAIAQAAALRGNANIEYATRSIGEPYPISDETVDIIIDATSSNSLSESERACYLAEMMRVLKPGGFIFARALCLDGDANAKQLIKDFPGTEPDTYVLPQVGVTERVFTRADFLEAYRNFEMLHLEKTTGYQKWGNQNYKRNYWVAYFMKK